MVDLAAVILAAGRSTRMKSALPKVLHPIAGRPMVRYVVDAVVGAGVQQIVVVVGNQSTAVREALGDTVEYAEQRDQLGTGHALLQARGLLDGQAKTVLLLYGDMPLVSIETLGRLLGHHRATGGTITVLTAIVDDPDGMGRIGRDGYGRFERIVEEKEATEAERAIREVNTGVYCFESSWLWPHLALLPRSSGGEFFLTDTVAMARSDGKTVESVQCADAAEALGINNRLQLSQAETVVRRWICERLMLDGVTIVDPASTTIDAGVRIGADTVVYPGTVIEGESDIGGGCRVGPNAVIRSSILGDGVEIASSRVEGTTIASGATVGPFAHIWHKARKRSGPKASELFE